MHFMETLKIRDVDGLLLWSSSLFYPLQAAERVSFEVNMSMNDRQFVKSIKVFIKFKVKVILQLCHFALPVKQFSEDLFICPDASLREEDRPLRIFALEQIMEVLRTSQYCVVLEGIGPPFGVIVVLLKEVEPVDVLPVRDRFRSNHQVGQEPAEQIQKNGLA